MILQHYWQRVGVQLPEPGTVAPRPGDTVVIKEREIIVPDPPSSSGEEQEECDSDEVYPGYALAPPFRAEASEDGDGGPYHRDGDGAEARAPEEETSTTVESSQGQLTQFAHDDRGAGDGGTPVLVLGWQSSLSLGVAFNAAFNGRDPFRTGRIDTEEVNELLRELGYEPESGEWVLNQFGVRQSTLLLYNEVWLLVQSVIGTGRHRCDRDPGGRGDGDGRIGNAT